MSIASEVRIRSSTWIIGHQQIISHWLWFLGKAAHNRKAQHCCTGVHATMSRQQWFPLKGAWQVDGKTILYSSWPLHSLPRKKLYEAKLWSFTTVSVSFICTQYFACCHNAHHRHAQIPYSDVLGYEWHAQMQRHLLLSILLQTS